MKDLREFREQLANAKTELDKVIKWLDEIQNQIQDQSQQVSEKETEQ